MLVATATTITRWQRREKVVELAEEGEGGDLVLMDEPSQFSLVLGITIACGGGCTQCVSTSGHKIMHNHPKGRRAGVPLSLIPLFFVGSAAGGGRIQKRRQ